MERIDAHQHFWRYEPQQYAWLHEGMSTLRKDFLPEDLLPVLERNGMHGCIAIQSEQGTEENAWQLENAAKWDFIRGVVGWIDLQSDNVEETLQYYTGFEKMKGFRHMLQGEAEPDFMLRPAFMRGVRLLANYNFTYDLLISPGQFANALQLVQAFPDQRFVIDHMGKPNIKTRETGDWESDIAAFGSCENVYCKISGMVTEADWESWEQHHFSHYFDVVTRTFGTNRLMFGSDWPVCLVAAPYSSVLQVATDYYSSFSRHEQDKIFGGNAVRFYGLEI